MMQGKEKMIQLLKERGIEDIRVLKAMNTVKRELFVCSDFQENAYEDRALGIDYQQTISQPYIVGFMTQAAGINSKSKVLEIGTGCGYQSAVLGEICKLVYTVEIIPELHKGAMERLKQLGYKNIFGKIGNGYEGWDENSPYDAIMVTAVADEVPMKLVEQLKVRGKMIIPIKEGKEEVLVCIYKMNAVNEYKMKKFFPVRFVPMVHG